MSATADIKIRLDANLKRQFDQLCRNGGTTMTAEVNRLISDMVEGVVPCTRVHPPEPNDQSNIERPDDEPPELQVNRQVLANLGAVSERIEQLVDAHPRFWFEKFYAGGFAKSSEALNHLRIEQDKHHKAANEALKAARTHIEEVAHLAFHSEPRFYRSYKIWTAFAAGALALIILVALLPGESPVSRFIAVKAVGGKSPLHAATIIAGGDAFHGNLIHETVAFMQTEPFASQYAACTDRAKRSHKAKACTLKFPAIVEDR